MRNLILITLFSLVTSLQSFAQKPNHHEINKLDKQIELLLDSAAKHMLSFIITKSENEYNNAIKLVKDAEGLNAQLIALAAGEKGLAGNIEGEIVEERKEEMAGYQNPVLKKTIMEDADPVKDQKVHYAGQKYMLSKPMKRLFDQYSAYLPKN